MSDSLASSAPRARLFARMRYDGAKLSFLEDERSRMASYCTTQGRARAEIVEKKSRFIATVQHVETEEEALAFLDEIRSEHRMARHNVYAYVLRTLK